jgi:anti-anti-sigma factor
LVVRRIGSLAVVELPTEIDLSNAGSVADALLGVLAEQASDVAALVVDMTATSFCGVRGVAALLAVHEQARRLGVGLSVVVPRPRMHWLFEHVSAERLIALHPTLDEALAAEDARSGEFEAASEG